MTSAQPEAAPVVVADAPSDAFLSVRDLHVSFPTEDGIVRAVNGINLDLARGKTLGIVGESGSGKSVTSQAILGLLKGTTANVTGNIVLDGHDLVTASEAEMRALRGDAMAMIFQDPLSALHSRSIQRRRPDRRGAAACTILACRQVCGARNAGPSSSWQGRRDPGCRSAVTPAPIPHEYSGGMRQRAMIAMALICERPEGASSPTSRRRRST